VYHLATAGYGAPPTDYSSAMEVIGQLQCALQRAGYDPGGLDGLWGKNTETAVSALVKAGGSYATLGLNEADIQAAIAYQKTKKAERPAGFVPTSVMACGIPGAAAAGWAGRNWPWLAGGTIAAGVIATAIYFAMRKPAPKHSMGFTYNNPWAKQAGYV